MDFQGQEERMVTENQEDSDCYSDVETVSSCENLLFRVNTLAPMVAPVTSQSRSRPSHILRSFQSSPSLRHSVKSPFVYMFPAGVVIEREEDRTFPLPENVHVWARYGFLDESYLHERRDPNPGQEPQQQAPVDAGRRRQGRMEDNLMRSIGRHAESMANESTSTQNRAHPGLNSSRPRRPRNVPQQSLSASSVDRDGFTSTSGRPRAMSEGIQSPTPGSSTPRTVKLTPSPQERVRPKAAVRNQASEGRTRGVRARNRSVNSFSEADARAVAATRRRRPSSEDETGAVDAAGAGETKEDELRDSHQDNGALRNAHKDRSMNQAEGRIANGAEQNTARRRPPRTPAEMERHKRNRAERLRAHGCHRTLYPRIAPGAAAVGAASNRGNATAEEIETVQWVDTLRISASIRGESLMATCTRSFAEQRSAIQLEEKQSEARACRTPDVSEMEGPDGLLHCAVLRGDHALAARAAQFLVDMRGANVNSRDAWGRTPLHTASGKGMASMAKFFIRRGANINALDNDKRTPLFFACAGGHTTVARYLTRIEVGARVDLRDNLDNLAGEFFWETVESEARDEVLSLLVETGWPDPPRLRPPRQTLRRSKSLGKSGRSSSFSHGRERERSGSSRQETHIYS